MQINDVHGYVNAHPEMFIEHGGLQFRRAGGYARISTMLQEARKENPEGVLAFDNGDTFHGTYPVVASKGADLIPIVNALEFDAMTAHWEFAYGPKQFEHIASQLNYPVLACNCYDQETNERVFPAYQLIERGGLHIGVIGVAEHIVDKTMPPHFSEGVYFTLGNEEIPGIIDELRNEHHVDLIIVLSHFGFPQEVKLASEVDGIDILLSSHTHNRLSEPVIVNDTIIIQSGCHGTFIGKLDVEVQNNTVTSFSHKLMEVSEDIEPDANVQKLIDNIIQPHSNMLEQVIGKTDTILHRYAQLETTMDNLLLQALVETSGSNLAFSNGWRYGGPILKGDVTMNDLWNIIPTNPPVSTVELTGKELIDMLEENLERTFSSDPYEQMGGYVKRCLGLTMYVKLENPAGMRILDLFIGRKPVEKNRVYTATFVTAQGVPQKYGVNRRNLEIDAIEALKQYFEKNKVVSADLRGTIQVI